MLKTGQIKVSRNHKGRLVLRFPFDTDTIEKVRAVHSAWWHARERCWTFQDSEPVRKRLEESLKIQCLAEPARLSAPAQDPGTMPPPPHPFHELKRELASRNLSPKTRSAYLFHNRNLLKHANKPPARINQTDIKEYLYHLCTEKQYAAATLDLTVNALKFYYGNVLKKDFIYQLIRPRQDKKMPVVLNTAETEQLINAIPHIKYKCIAALLYSSGLRVGEVVTLRPQDIDSERMMIHVHAGKGRKDRYTILSERALEFLRTYYKAFRPEEWLFPSRVTKTYISIRFVEKMISEAIVRAGIRKAVTPHTLRHSFATHLYEAGTDIHSIQKLLGHSSPKTTSIYMHVSTKSLEKIKSPFDLIQKKEPPQ